MENQLRQKAKELLSSSQVKVVIGYQAGSVPFKSSPVLAETPEDAEKLIWNPTCVNNLAVYLPEACAQGKAAVVVKPCDAASVVELIKEKQIQRDSVVLLAVSCPGVLNTDALSDVDPGDVKSVEWKDGSIALTTHSGNLALSPDTAFAAKCLSCELTEAALADVSLGDPIARNPARDEYTDVEEIASMTPEERRAYWARQFERCIRCYGCRAVCPGCYCKECFVDKPAQLWVSKAIGPEANWFFHMGRAMHMAGRCIGCGECERICPMGIPITRLSKKLQKEIEDMFGYKPGTDREALPVLGTFDMKDPDPCPE